MRQKFVVRLLDAADGLLGWSEAFVAPRSGGIFTLEAPLLFAIEAPGQITRCSIHWTDLDVARVVDIPDAPEVSVGMPVALPSGFGLWAVPNDPAAPRPAVTVRTSITLSPGPAGIGAIGKGLGNG